MNKGTLFCTLLTLGVILFSANCVFAQGPVANGYDNPLLAENIVQFTWQAITFLFTASLYFAVLMIIIGSYVMVTSGGIPSKIDKGKKIVIWTLVAVAIIIASRGIIELVWLLLGKQ